MGSSGLIIAFVVALWAAYFVPLVLRRYDEAGKNSSLDLEGPLRRVVNPRRRAVQEEAPVSAVAPQNVQTQNQPTQSRSSQVAAQRRRRTLLTLLGLLVVVSAVTAFGVIPVWAPAIPVALVAAWLVACRIQVRGELGLSRPRAEQSDEDLEDEIPTEIPAPRRDLFARFRRTAAKIAPQRGHAGEEEDTIIVSHQFEDVDPHRPHVMEVAELPADALEERLEIAVPSMADNGHALWDPLPITLPTYVTKPRVGRTVRTIDFGSSDSWTSGHVEGEVTDLPAGRRDDGFGQQAVGH